MNIEIHDAALEARIQKLLQATGSSSVKEVLLHLVETQEEQDRWLLENRATVNAKIMTGIDQLDRAEGVPEDTPTEDEERAAADCSTHVSLNGFN
jgi:hypothetical protein